MPPSAVLRPSEIKDFSALKLALENPSALELGSKEESQERAASLLSSFHEHNKGLVIVWSEVKTWLKDKDAQEYPPHAVANVAPLLCRSILSEHLGRGLRQADFFLAPEEIKRDTDPAWSKLEFVIDRSGFDPSLINSSGRLGIHSWSEHFFEAVVKEFTSHSEHSLRWNPELKDIFKLLCKELVHSIPDLSASQAGVRALVAFTHCVYDIPEAETLRSNNIHVAMNARWNSKPTLVPRRVSESVLPAWSEIRFPLFDK